MYVAVKGGEQAIDNAHRLLDRARRGDPTVSEIGVAQISEQLSLAVARVMCEGSLYDPEIAALAVKQSRGDLIEAIFLVRAYRTTLPRFGASEPLTTDRMRCIRRISATYKDLPGGQILGPTFDYTHRLIDFTLLGDKDAAPAVERGELSEAMPRVTAILGGESLIEGNRPASDDEPVGDLTREPLALPAARDVRLQNLARADEGFLLSLGYSTQRGYGSTHPFVGEIRIGAVEVEFFSEELGFAVSLGEITVTECEMVTRFAGSATEAPRFTRGYGLVFGQSERKAMSMALVDRSLRADEFGEDRNAPAQDEEFVLSHSDIVEHLKLPHYVDFQSELQLLRKLRAEWAAGRAPRSDEVAE
jgi:alpha-D-ribose 1-methylphosphonate 5-triphosphate synthase subunit PhnI